MSTISPYSLDAVLGALVTSQGRKHYGSLVEHVRAHTHTYTHTHTHTHTLVYEFPGQNCMLACGGSIVILQGVGSAIPRCELDFRLTVLERAQLRPNVTSMGSSSQAQANCAAFVLSHALVVEYRRLEVHFVLECVQ